MRLMERLCANALCSPDSCASNTGSDQRVADQLHPATSAISDPADELPGRPPRSRHGRLWPGTYYFVMTAFNSIGADSRQSNPASKTIPQSLRARSGVP